jgi:hypothetical protein
MTVLAVLARDFRSTLLAMSLVVFWFGALPVGSFVESHANGAYVLGLGEEVFPKLLIDLAVNSLTMLHDIPVSTMLQLICVKFRKVWSFQLPLSEQGHSCIESLCGINLSE